MKIQMAGFMAATAISGGAFAQDAVQWRVEDGGNGHWYRFEQTVLHWEPHQNQAVSLGANLASVTTAAERAFVESILSVQKNDIRLGGLANWPSQPTWLTGEQIVAAGWCFGGYTPGSGYAVEICARGDCPTAFCWNIESEDCLCWPGNRAVYEWSADCNSDGIVDFGQIRDGTIADANLNNIPDCCEGGPNCGPCIADVVQDGTVNGVDLAAVINAWGTDGGKLPRADIDGSGLVDGADLAQVLGSWGPCN